MTADKRKKIEIKKYKSLFKDNPPNFYRFITPREIVPKQNSQKNNNLKLKYIPCPYLWYSLVMSWDGKILPCCWNFYDYIVLGDANNDSILKVWNNDILQNLRSKISRGEIAEISFCANCDFLWQESIFGFTKKNINDFILCNREFLGF